MTVTTRDKLLSTAIDLFWQDGLGAVSVDDICKKANVKKGSFYHYFKSKTELTLEAFDRLWSDCEAQMREAFAPSYKPLERLKNYCEIIYAKQAEKFEQTGRVLGCPFASCGNEACMREERIRLKVTEIYDQYAFFLERTLLDARQEGLAGVHDAAVMAREMISYVIGVTHQAKLKNDLELIRRDLLPGLMRYLSPGSPYTIKQVKSASHTPAATIA